MCEMRNLCDYGYSLLVNFCKNNNKLFKISINKSDSNHIHRLYKVLCS